MLTYANPNRFMQLARRLTFPVWGLSLACLSIGLYMAFSAPADYQQGMTVRIMLNVPLPV
ncbi:MAG TPA: heme transporter HemC, partial [Rhodobiaceae bacterium]|nr:heme transporter HemC [Rhodobiaceae bacterium]